MKIGFFFQVCYGRLPFVQSPNESITEAVPDAEQDTRQAQRSEADP